MTVDLTTNSLCPGLARKTAQAELASERAGKEEALLRASRAERELDQARARAAVLDNKVTVSSKREFDCDLAEYRTLQDGALVRICLL